MKCMWQRAFWLLPMLLGAEDVPVGVASGYISDIQPADLVEIVADRRLIDGTPCYVRTVRLADMSKKESGRMRITYRAVTENIIPRGEYQWAGTVSELTADKMILRTRADGYKTIVLRQDTRYLEDGVVSEWDRLRPNTRVSIRAGRNFEGAVEVYQIVWGSVTPR